MPATWSDPINVSALNQFSYCPRRCALIYIEGQFSDNVHTARGNAEHARVDRISHSSTKDGARVEYALPIWNERLGLIGKCDVVEFWLDGTVFPVEYKHGARRQRDNDDLQIAAQAMCLEEMLGRPVHMGAIYHATSRRRREVMIDPDLRGRVDEAVRQIRVLLSVAKLPAPVNDRRCAECSMQQTCQPTALADTARLRELARTLFEPAE